MVSIKSKYILMNDTGLGIEFKQRNTPDPGDARYLSYGEGRRFAGPLQPTERCGPGGARDVHDRVWRGGRAAHAICCAACTARGEKYVPPAARV